MFLGMARITWWHVVGDAWMWVCEGRYDDEEDVGVYVDDVVDDVGMIGEV